MHGERYADRCSAQRDAFSLSFSDKAFVSYTYEGLADYLRAPVTLMWAGSRQRMHEASSNYPCTVCCRLMDRMQQRPIITEPCGAKVQPGPCVFVKASPGLAPQLTVQEPPPISPAGVLKKQPELNPTQATDKLLSDQPKPASTHATLASISRPRPTALGTKPAAKKTRISVDPSTEIHLIPVCAPGRQGASVLQHSPTESSVPFNSPQGPQSPQSSTSRPYLSPTTSLSPKPSLSPPTQRAASPGSSTQNQVQPEKPEENNHFR